MRYILICGAAALFLFTGLNGVTAGTVNGVQALVHDSVITMHDVQELTAPAVPQLRRDYAGQGEALVKRLQALERENLDQLTQRQLILHDFKTSGYNLPESILNDMVNERIKAKYGDRRTATRSLQAEGITYEKFRQRLREQFVVEAMRNKHVSSEIIISPHKVQTWYENNKQQFQVEDQVKLRMIFLSRTNDPAAPNPNRLAEELLMKVKEGTPFTELAALYSQRAARGNEGEWFGHTQLRKELLDAVTPLKAGETSAVIETPEAVYLAHVEEVRPAHIKPLGEVRSTIEGNLLIEERSRLEKQWTNRLKKKTFVRYY